MRPESQTLPRAGQPGAGTDQDANAARYVAWFHDLDAWTEYWDLFHPESKGRYYFGDGQDETGLLSAFMPRRTWPEPFRAWVAMATGSGPAQAFEEAVSVDHVRTAILEVDALVAGLFATHFGDAGSSITDYLEATHRFATDTLPPATERYALVPEGDHRRRTAGRHTLDGDVMWFAWSLHLEASHLLDPDDPVAERRRALMMAAVVTGCAANFAWGGHRRTRPGYRADEATAALLRQLGLDLAADFGAARDEVHALYRIREWGHE
jgi:hypothetical protein